DVALTLSGSNKLLSPLVYDTTPPTATVVSPASGQVLNAGISQITVQFSEAVLDAGPGGSHSVTNPAGYALLNTTTHQAVPVLAVSYNPATFRAVLTVASGSSVLADGAYQVTVKGQDPVNAIEDLSTNLLGGGHDLVSAFSIETAAPTIQQFTL